MTVIVGGGAQEEAGPSAPSCHKYRHVDETASMQYAAMLPEGAATAYKSCPLHDSESKKREKEARDGVREYVLPSPGGAPERANCIRSPKVCMVLDKRHAVFLCERRLSSCAVQLIVVVAR